jgi:cell division protein FtsQ
MSSAVAQRIPVDPRIDQRRTEVARARSRRRLRLLFVLGGVAVLALATVSVAYYTPLFAARHVRVVGAVHTPASQVVRVAGLAGHPPLMAVNGGADAARLEALPWIATATVERRWPDSVVVRVVERAPMAAVARPAGSQAPWALVDGTGRVLEWTQTAPPGLVQLHAPASVGRPGSQLAAPARPGLAVASALGALESSVHEVRVSSDGEVTLVLSGGVTAVLGSDDELGPKLAALRSVLAGAPPTGPETIDVTVPGEASVGPAQP